MPVTKCYCPVCKTSMKKWKVQPNAHARDRRNRLIEVARVFFGCPKEACGTIIWFDYRRDGREGDLHKKLMTEKSLGGIKLNPGNLPELKGRMDEIVDDTHG